jgi:hypothetical protein
MADKELTHKKFIGSGEDVPLTQEELNSLIESSQATDSEKQEESEYDYAYD